ncbi:unnamed protein product, partial [Heterotrigona itama]
MLRQTTFSRVHHCDKFLAKRTALVGIIRNNRRELSKLVKTKDKIINVNNESECLRQLRIIINTKFSVDVTDQNTASNSNPIDGLCKFFSISLIWP